MVHIFILRIRLPRSLPMNIRCAMHTIPKIKPPEMPILISTTSYPRPAIFRNIPLLTKAKCKHILTICRKRQVCMASCFRYNNDGREYFMFETYDDILTITDVAEILKTGTTQVYKIVRSGQLKGYKEGKDWKITKQALIRYVTDHSHL